ncbi:hypothetical protein ACCO45_010746 [Purpureocillium lilacinum]|uniref:Uncharacterized protein n=1 Tax=Purpureocillium lilacinum TaxID=33203 RepID=A0ACC4DGG3_PURLI
MNASKRHFGISCGVGSLDSKSQVAPRSRTFSSKSSSPTATRAEGHQTHSFDSSGGASLALGGLPVAPRKDPVDHVLGELVLAVIRVQLVVGALVRLAGLVLDAALPLHELHGRVVAAGLVGGAVCQQHAAHLLAQLDLARRQQRRPVQQRGEPLERARVVAQRVVAHRLDDGRVPAELLGRHDVLHLLLGQQAADEAPGEDLDAAGLLALGEADEGALEDPAAHLADQLGVLRVARHGQHLAAAHGVAHDEQRRRLRALAPDPTASFSRTKAATSLTTRGVGPVRPRSDGLVTVRPQPRWSHEKTWMPCAASRGKKSL